MKHIKKFNESDELLDFEFEQKPMDYYEAFEKLVKGQKIIGRTQITYFYGTVYGVELENGYKLAYYGGGCSGEDCNDTYIFDLNDKLIATESLDN